MENLSKKELYALFKEEKEQGLRKFYEYHKVTFLTWAQRKFELEEQDLLDIYQDAIIVLYKMVQNNDLGKIQGSTTSYLFGISRNLALKHQLSLTKRKKELERLLYNVPNLSVVPIETEKDWNKTKLTKALSLLGPNCKEILTLFYFYKYNMEDIGDQMGYGNASVVKSKKYQCLQKLKTLFNNVKEE